MQVSPHSRWVLDVSAPSQPLPSRRLLPLFFQSSKAVQGSRADPKKRTTFSFSQQINLLNCLPEPVLTSQSIHRDGVAIIHVCDLHSVLITVVLLLAIFQISAVG